MLLTAHEDSTAGVGLAQGTGCDVHKGVCLFSAKRLSCPVLAVGHELFLYTHFMEAMHGANAWRQRMNKSAAFWDKLAHRYAKGAIRDPESYEVKLVKTREYFTAESEVVEIACGTGTTAISHAPFVRHIYATDISSKMIEICREKADAAGVSNITFEGKGIDELTIADNSVDMVMLHSILHLVPDVAGLVEKARAMLKPGGVLVSSTACLAEAPWFWKVIIPPMKLAGLAPYVNFFSQAELEADMTRTGFEIEHVWRPSRNKAAFIIARKPHM